MLPFHVHIRKILNHVLVTQSESDSRIYFASSGASESQYHSNKSDPRILMRHNMKHHLKVRLWDHRWGTGWGSNGHRKGGALLAASWMILESDFLRWCRPLEAPLEAQEIRKSLRVTHLGNLFLLESFLPGVIMYPCTYDSAQKANKWGRETKIPKILQM